MEIVPSRGSSGEPWCETFSIKEFEKKFGRVVSTIFFLRVPAPPTTRSPSHRLGWHAHQQICIKVGAPCDSCLLMNCARRIFEPVQHTNQRLHDHSSATDLQLPHDLKVRSNPIIHQPKSGKPVNSNASIVIEIIPLSVQSRATISALVQTFLV